LQQRGFEVSQLKSQNGGPPAVFGTLKSPGRSAPWSSMLITTGNPSPRRNGPRIPSSPDAKRRLNTGEHEVDWKSTRGPFDPEWRLYGRAVSDDKASIVAFLAGAMR